MDDGPDTILILLRFPSGERMKRRFLRSDKINVMDFIESNN